MGVFIIAEIGVNHNGDVGTAKKMVEVAKKAGCNAVKFQTFIAENLVTMSAKKAEYQIRNTGNSENQYEMLKKLEFTYNDFLDLKSFCDETGIMFLSTPFDEESSDILEKLGVEMYKIPSGEITNKGLLKHISKKYKPIILSTGMSTLGEVEEAINWIHEESNSKITLLHCTSNYPTNPEDVNLRAMLTLKESFKTEVGYSDHTYGIEISCAAVALGAEIIEKHFTLDRNMEGPDHKASLEPYELELLVKSIRNIEEALGDGIKKPKESELSTRIVARKSIVATKNINKGDIITKENLCVKRPGSGLEPKYLEYVIDKKAKNDITVDQQISFNDI